MTEGPAFAVRLHREMEAGHDREELRKPLQPMANRICLDQAKTKVLLQPFFCVLHPTNREFWLSGQWEWRGSEKCGLAFPRQAESGSWCS